MLGLPVHDGLQVDCGFANLVRQNRAVQIKTRACEDLALTIERQMICLFVDQHMGERRLPSATRPCRSGRHISGAR